MSRTEDHARSGTSATDAPDSNLSDSLSDDDGTVLPASDWSVDDDSPVSGIDPLIGSDRKGSSSADIAGAVTGEVPVVKSPVAKTTAPRRVERSTKANRTPRQPEDRLPPTEPVEVQPVQDTAVIEVARDPRSWDVDDDLGPWQSHQDAIGTPATPIYLPEPANHDVAPGRRVIRRTTRILRHIDPWSTFKVGLLFSAVGYLVTMTSGVLLWNVADRTGTLDNVQRWLTSFGWETFELDGSDIFTNAAMAGLFLAVGATGALVMFVTIFNLASDAVGGIRMTVLEEERVRHLDDVYGDVDPSYGLEISGRGDWHVGD